MVIIKIKLKKQRKAIFLLIKSGGENSNNDALTGYLSVDILSVVTLVFQVDAPSLIA
jgi:hypothetical protein